MRFDCNEICGTMSEVAAYGTAILTGPDTGEHWSLIGLLSYWRPRPRASFAVGDVRHGSMKRVASAVGDGSTTVRLIHDYLALAPPVRKGLENL